MHKKFVVAVIAGLTLIFPPLMEFQPISADEGGKLLIVENDWPPYFFGEQTGGPEGFAKEILKDCLDKMDIDYKFQFFPVKRMYAYLKSGQLDIAVFSYKKERESFLIYSKVPLFHTGYRPVVLSRSGIEIKTLQDFDALRLGHLAGLKYSKPFFEYIQERKASGNLIVTTTGGSCLKMLLGDIIDIFVDTRDTTLWRSKQMGVTDKITVLDYDISTKAYFIAISKNSKVIKDKEAFLEQLEHFITVSKENGFREQLALKYGIN